MTSTLFLSVFYFESLLTFLVWAAMVVLNLWIWQKSKAQSNLLMMVGAGLIGLMFLFQVLGVYFSAVYWMFLIGSVLLLVGFYMSVKPMVAAQLAALQAKVKSAASNVTHKDGGGSSTPPPPPPPPPAPR